MRRVAFMIVLAGWALLPGLSGCGYGASPSPFLSRALDAHRLADAQVERGDLDAARQNLVALLAAEPPAGIAPADVRVVRQDAYFRLVELELSAGRAVAAVAFAEQGLALGGSDDLFVANLHLGHGRALERQGRDADAAAAYHRALAINERLLEEALSGGEAE